MIENDNQGCSAHLKKAFDWLEEIIKRSLDAHISNIFAEIALSTKKHGINPFEMIELISYLYNCLLEDDNLHATKDAKLHVTSHLLDKIAGSFEHYKLGITEDFLERLKKSFTFAETTNYVLKEAKNFIDEEGIDIAANALATFLYYCDGCDCLHLCLMMRDSKRKLSVSFSVNKINELNRLISELEKVRAVFQNSDGETSIIEEIKKDKYSYWTIFRDSDDDAIP